MVREFYKREGNQVGKHNIGDNKGQITYHARNQTFENSKDMTKKTGIPHFRDMRLTDEVKYIGTSPAFTNARTWEANGIYYDIMEGARNIDGSYSTQIRVRKNKNNEFDHAQGFDIKWKMKNIGNGKRSNGKMVQYLQSTVTIKPNNEFVVGKVKNKVIPGKTEYVFVCDMEKMPDGIDNMMLMRIIADSTSRNIQHRAGFAATGFFMDGKKPKAELSRKHSVIDYYEVAIEDDYTIIDDEVVHNFGAYGEDVENGQARQIIGVSNVPVESVEIEDISANTFSIRFENEDESKTKFVVTTNDTRIE